MKNSTVNVSDNAQGYGIYAHDFYAENSTIITNNNGYSGIRISGKGQFINSTVTINGTLAKGKAALELANVKGERGERNIGSLEVRNSTLNISGNGAVGIRCNKGTKLDIDDISRVTIKNNHATIDNGWNDMPNLAGGLLICSGASAKLGANTVINNNHADTAGDDIVIQPGGSLTFSVRNGTGNGDLLDDCSDGIDGWYLDGADSRRIQANEGGTEINVGDIEKDLQLKKSETQRKQKQLESLQQQAENDPSKQSELHKVKSKVEQLKKEEEKLKSQMYSA